MSILKKHANLIRTPSGWRVRVMRGGVTHGQHWTAMEDAIAERQALRRQLGRAGRSGRRRRHDPSPAEHKRQVKALPPGTELRNIRWVGHGYRVAIMRGGIGHISGGFFSGPDALSRAVVRRDELEADYPVNR